MNTADFEAIIAQGLAEGKTYPCHRDMEVAKLSTAILTTIDAVCDLVRNEDGSPMKLSNEEVLIGMTTAVTTQIACIAVEGHMGHRFARLAASMVTVTMLKSIDAAFDAVEKVARDKETEE